MWSPGGFPAGGVFLWRMERQQSVSSAVRRCKIVSLVQLKTFVGSFCECCPAEHGVKAGHSFPGETYLWYLPLDTRFRGGFHTWYVCARSR